MNFSKNIITFYYIQKIKLLITYNHYFSRGGIDNNYS